MDFISVKLIKKCLRAGQSASIILNASNEILVSFFLQKRIKFTDITRFLDKIFRHKDFKKYAIKKANSLREIYMLDQWARETTIKLIERF